MKNYKQILEAIKRGINLALDDYEEQDGFAIPQKDVIKNNNSVKELLDFYGAFVDLGLPSGTLWGKYNLGVNTKKLKEPKDYYGKFFAWGELTEKDWYNWANYDWAYMHQNRLTKYCNSASYGYDGFVDNMQNLKLEDDIVAKTFGKGFHIPTSIQVEELLKHTNYKMVKDFGIEGLHGLLCQSKVNDNYIFLPMSGWKTDIDKSKNKCKWHDMGQHCEIWTSDQYNCGSPTYANVLSANIQFINKPQSDNRIGIYQTLRCWGLPIRPVQN